jgi:hypothetical protein
MNSLNPGETGALGVIRYISQYPACPNEVILGKGAPPFVLVIV